MTDDTFPARPAVTALKESIGRYGLWSLALRQPDPARRPELADTVRELEDIGYRALWVGGGAVQHARTIVEETSRLTVGTSIQRIWDFEPADVAEEFADLERAHPGRFLLGLGVSHAATVARYARPYTAMTGYLDVLDARGLPAERRLLAALGPKMTALARDRAAGALPYMSTIAHVTQARAALGPAPLLAPEVKAVLESDPERARAVGRLHLGPSLTAPNYANSFLRAGFTEADLVDGGSDRLLDAVVAWGDAARIKDRLDAFLDAGADHVAVQLLTEEPLPVDYADKGQPVTGLRDGWRRLAGALFG